MKSFFKVLLNIFTFGLPLFLEILSNSRKFRTIINQAIYVKVNAVDQTVSLKANGKLNINLLIDELIVSQSTQGLTDIGQVDPE